MPSQAGRSRRSSWLVVREKFFNLPAQRGSPHIRGQDKWPVNNGSSRARSDASRRGASGSMTFNSICDPIPASASRSLCRMQLASRKALAKRRRDYGFRR
jgi:hypothetical protein